MGSPEQHDDLFRKVVSERSERMRKLIPVERDVLIRFYGDKVIDLREILRARRAGLL